MHKQKGWVVWCLHLSHKVLEVWPPHDTKRKKRKNIDPQTPKQGFLIFFNFVIWSNSQSSIRRFTQIQLIPYTQVKIFLNVFTFSYLLKPNDEIWFFKKMIENIKICWIRAIFSKKKSFEIVEISILKTGRNYAEVQKIKRKHYIAIFPFFLQKIAKIWKKKLVHIWTLTLVW
jgi:hypothetical protein